ncbi:hypothetical protein [Terrisporobacter mayombei]|uniref:Uncharacterized protein n=1 Tax=Terrisporobacter mayombei TaxID=1541 RepID=A0ABY9PXS0_9FIRM|nr:hypothetical protein [Terrisporobacter mayombei]MCC3868306.1 hypothetical protein [Terrisporobacter mayombei]WMT80447.1 hypothetical protein TEMA_07640 [Terrisporobacter mayombei]
MAKKSNEKSKMVDQKNNKMEDKMTDRKADKMTDKVNVNDQCSDCSNCK